MHSLPLTQRLLIGLAVFTAFGTIAHDTRFDSALLLALPMVAVTSVVGTQSFDFGDSAHLHVERASVSQVFITSTPKINARDDHRRYQIPKYFGRTSGLFGDSSVTWPSV